ncbi:MAG TPA: hypothetical protein VFC99_20390, partial [Acidimicrobiia bacterium]|nr:hypothetical protein [Acidimicrobiia bacterium]
MTRHRSIGAGKVLGARLCVFVLGVAAAIVVLAPAASAQTDPCFFCPPDTTTTLPPDTTTLPPDTTTLPPDTTT